MSVKLNIDLLKKLCETPGIPGREERVRDLIIAETKGLFDDVRTDPMGNLICRRDPRTAKGSRSTSAVSTAKKTTSRSRRSSGESGNEPTRVAMMCHMDEIGFYVKSIDDKGFIWVNPAGGFDTRNLFSRRVTVCTPAGDLPGVMNPGGRPIHISSPEDRKKVPEVKEFFIDIGLPAAKVKRDVRIGDYIVMDEPFRKVGDKLVSKALDNRVACWLGIESVRQIDASGTGHACELYAAFTVQEEVGLRGARTCAYAIRPHVGIGLDVTLACDTPGVPSEESVSIHGKGFALHVMDSSFISDHKLVDDIEALAKKKRIPYQRSILAAGGQDGAAAQQAASGARAVGITVGTRYIHTVTEMIDGADLAAARDILAAWIPTIE